jgi:hypothetical protein
MAINETQHERIKQRVENRLQQLKQEQAEHPDRLGRLKRLYAFYEKVLMCKHEFVYEGGAMGADINTCTLCGYDDIY